MFLKIKKENENHWQYDMENKPKELKITKIKNAEFEKCGINKIFQMNLFNI